MDDLLTVRQVAIILKVHPLSVRRYITQGKLKAIKLAGNVRVSQTDLRSFSQNYVPNTKPDKNSANRETAGTNPFSASDSLFRLRGRGLSLDRFGE